MAESPEAVEVASMFKNTGFICTGDLGLEADFRAQHPRGFYLWAVETVKLGASLSLGCAGRRDMETPVGRAEHGGREWESLQSLSGEGRAEWSSEIAGKSPGRGSIQVRRKSVSLGSGFTDRSITFNTAEASDCGLAGHYCIFILGCRVGSSA